LVTSWFSNQSKNKLINKEKELFFLINSLRLGGAEKNCVNLANGLSEKGFKVTIIVLELKDAVMAEKLLPPIDIINLNVNHARNSLFSLKRVIDVYNIRQLLVFTFQLAIVTVMIRRIWKKEIRIIARSINSIEEKYRHERSLWHKWVSQFLVKTWFFNVDHIIAQSTGMKQELEELKGQKNVPVSVIFNFLDHITNEVPTATKESSLRVLFVGKLKTQKNLYFLIDAFEIAWKSKKELELCIVGDGEQKAGLENYVKQKGLEKVVRFAGKSNDVAKYYQESMVTVLCSHYEGFPNVLIEANAYGVPVVSLDCPSGPSDIVIPFVNGILVKDKKVDTFAASILKSVEFDWDKNAILNTVQRFSKEKAINGYLKVLNLEAD
jgi:glycosyltransferase involved in cell wall biosynthesis